MPKLDRLPSLPFPLAFAQLLSEYKCELIAGGEDPHLVYKIVGMCEAHMRQACLSTTLDLARIVKDQSRRLA